MGAQMFVRGSDGTGIEGHIMFNLRSMRESKLKLEFTDNVLPSYDDIYALYGVCPALRISENEISGAGSINTVYNFLYGHTVGELMRLQEKKGMFDLSENYIYEPKEWTTEMVESMNWELFCLAYYAFLSSKSNFESKAWKILKFVLAVLKESPNILHLLLSRAGRQSDTSACLNFWETISDGLQARTLDCLSEKTCYNAFQAMIEVEPFILEENYKNLKTECMELFDSLARKRIDEACRQTYTVREIVNLNIETLFFYNEYFAEFSSMSTTEQYVKETFFEFLSNMGDEVAGTCEMLDADAIYVKALQYAHNDEEIDSITSRREKISHLVAAEEEEQRKIQLEMERKQEKEAKKDNLMEKLVPVLGVSYLVGVVADLLFGILTFLNIFNPASKIIFIVSLCITVPFSIIFLIEEIKQRRSRGKIKYFK